MKIMTILLLWCIGLCEAVASIDVTTYIPPQALQYLPIIAKEKDYAMPDFAYPYYFAGLIEHESCISLTHKRCWSPTSKLSTKRELGLGMGQITKTYRPDGSIRFDALSDLRKANMRELKELSWSNITQRPDLQIRAITIMSRSNYKALYMVKDPYQRLAMADAAYNGGLGSVNKDRRYCGMRSECDPQQWFDNVAIHSLKSRKPIYGTRSAYDISRNHVTDVLMVRMVKYQPYFK